MNAPVAVASTPQTDEGLDLTALLDLFDGTLRTDEETTSSWPVTAADLGTRVRELSVRAAGWGAGPQGAWRAW